MVFDDAFKNIYFLFKIVIIILMSQNSPTLHNQIFTKIYLTRYVFQILLGYLPLDSSSWKETYELNRQLYKQFAKDFILDPSILHHNQNQDAEFTVSLWIPKVCLYIHEGLSSAVCVEEAVVSLQTSHILILDIFFKKKKNLSGWWCESLHFGNES